MMDTSDQNPKLNDDDVKPSATQSKGSPDADAINVDSQASDAQEAAPDSATSVSEQPSTTEIDHASEPSDSQAKVPIKSQSRSWRLWAGVCLLILSALAVVGYLVYGQFIQMTQLSEQLAQTQQQLSQQQRQLATEVNQQLRAMQSNLSAAEEQNEQFKNQLQTEMAAQEELLIQTVQRLSRQQDISTDRWALEEALALLSLAQRRLQLDGHAKVAIDLLISADQILASLAQAAVLPVRRQIAADLLALRSVASVDVDGLYFQLEAIHQQLAALNWQPQPPTQTMTAKPEAPSGWPGFKQRLSRLFTLTRLDTTTRPLPLMDDAAQWQQQALLLTEQTQLALLAANQSLYDAALGQLHEHLVLMDDSLALTPLITQIDSIQGAQLNPELPDITASRQALEQYMVRTESQEPSS